MLQVDYQRWGQTPQELYELGLRSPPPRTRERFLALHALTEGSNATRQGARIGRNPQTVMDWAHQYNTQGPESLVYRRSGGGSPFFSGSPSHWPRN